MGDRPFNVEAIYEGICPSCSTPLERRESHSTDSEPCHTCGGRGRVETIAAARGDQ